MLNQLNKINYLYKFNNIIYIQKYYYRSISILNNNRIEYKKNFDKNNIYNLNFKYKNKKNVKYHNKNISFCNIKSIFKEKYNNDYIDDLTMRASMML